jgi:hypothetical protein
MPDHFARQPIEREVAIVLRLLGRMGRRIHDILTYVDYRLRRRSRIKKTKQEDPNIYPFW